MCIKFLVVIRFFAGMPFRKRKEQENKKKTQAIASKCKKYLIYLSSGKYPH